MKFLILLLLITACDTQLNKDREEYFKTLTLEQRFFMRSCMIRDYMASSCVKEMKEITDPETIARTQKLKEAEALKPVSITSGPKPESMTSGIVKTAVGTALGYGASKYIFHKVMGQ